MLMNCSQFSNITIRRFSSVFLNIFTLKKQVIIQNIIDLNKKYLPRQTINDNAS